MNLFKVVKRAVGRIFKRRGKRTSIRETKALSLLKKARKKAHIQKAEQPKLLPSPLIPLLPAPTINAEAALKSFAAVQLSAHTRRAYERDLREFFSYLKQGNLFDIWGQLGPSDIAGYRDYLIKEKNFAKTSVTRKIAVLKSFFSWNVAQGFVQRNPAETVRTFPQNQESSTGFLTEDQVGTLLTYLDHLDTFRLSNHLAQVGIECLLMTGARRSEVCQMKFEDLDLTGDMWTLRIRGKGGRDRRLPVAPRLLDTLEHWLRRLFDDECPMGNLHEHPGPWLDFLRRRATQPILISTKVMRFSKQLSDGELARLVRRHCLKARIPFRVSPHMLRSTAITHALDQGATHRGVQQMAGWTSPLMISRYDKKRMDPKYSAVHQLRYGQRKSENENEDPPPTDQLTAS